MHREFVIVCNEHKGICPGALLFWGNKTEDSCKRSFGGYTSDLEKCEKYTKSEIENFARFPYYNEKMTFDEFKHYEDIAIRMSDLNNFKELRIAKIVYRP